ncbi:MAG TPA: ATP-binding cassette domain-containing protein [Thermoanaerobaculia bacterium]|nr:ATP-binding cassette domain-containing protein [Thermoanaerobaculia bacterium]
MRRLASAPRRPLLIPETVQLSALDCGPAALHALCAGFGIRLPWDRLRESCRVGRDGSSIDTLEAVAGELGLAAEQVLVPADHLLLPEAGCLPAVVVVLAPGGATHFVTLWRRHGRRVQVMDPAGGRRWPRAAAFLAELYRHRATVPAAAWRAWADSADFLLPLAARLRALGMSGRDADALLAPAAAPGWLPLAALDAAARFVARLAGAGALRRGAETTRALLALWEAAAAAPPGPSNPVPGGDWSVRPAAARSGHGEELRVAGALLVRVRGWREERAWRPAACSGRAPAVAAAGRPPGRLDPFKLQGGLVAGIVASTVGRLVETIALAAASRLLLTPGTPHSRGAVLAVIALVAALAAAILLLELAEVTAGLAAGRRLETRFRLRLLAALPLLPDRYLRTRLPADLAERAHLVAQLRRGPELAGRAVSSALEVLVAAAAIAWLDPRLSAWLAAAIAAALLVPLLLAPGAQDRDRRLRAHAAALGGHYLDLLRGLAPARAHGAAAALRGRHDQLLAGWLRALRARSRLAAGAEGAAELLLAAAAIALVLRHVAGVASGGPGPETLLLALWAAQLAAGGQRLAVAVAVELPLLRTLFDRLQELLAAAAAEAADAEAPAELEAAADPDLDARGAPAARADAGVTVRAADVTSNPGVAVYSADVTSNPGVALELAGVSVEVDGRELLSGLDLAIPAGQHVAVVGASGAGKTTLISTLLGWHEPARGSLCIDGRRLTPVARRALRRRTAWAAPGVYLWDRSLLANLCYAAEGRCSPAASPPASFPDADGGSCSAAEALRAAELLDLPAELAHGLQTRLGEGGGRLSGGEGQRLRLARALLQPGVGLALLDEPCRGLDRAQRRRLLERARARWRQATVLCVTHSPAEAAGFERALVLDGGRLAEDGWPAELAARSSSRFAGLLAAERQAESALASASWRQLRLEHGRLVERPQEAAVPAPLDADPRTEAGPSRRRRVESLTLDAATRASATASTFDASNVEALHALLLDGDR